MHKESIDEFADNENYGKVWYHCHYTENYRDATRNICNSRYKTLKEIPVALHNISNCNFHFIITESVEEFKGQFKSLIKKVLILCINKQNETSETVTHKIRLKINVMFVLNSLSSLTDNFANQAKRANTKTVNTALNMWQ